MEDGKVVTDWDSMKGCMFSEKRWVNPKDIEQDKVGYEKGDFLRVWCMHNIDWCECETDDPDDCMIYTDHRDE